MGRQILEEEKQKKEAERLAKLPKEPEKLPSPKFKTVRKVSGYIQNGVIIKKLGAYNGIGNDFYHTYDYVKVKIPDGPSKEEIKRQKEEEEEAKLVRQIEEEKESRRISKKPRFDAKANKIRELERKVQSALNNQTAKVPKKKTYQKPLFKKEANPTDGKAQ